MKTCFHRTQHNLLLAIVRMGIVGLWCALCIVSSLSYAADGPKGGTDINKTFDQMKDKLPNQVLLEVHIFEVILRNEDEIGFLYDIVGEVGEFRGTTLGGADIAESNLTVLGMGNRNSLLPAGANIAAAVFQGDRGEIHAIFQALAEDQIIKVHANPIIMTLEGVPALLKAGDEIPFLAREITGNVETFVTKTETTGTELYITPTVDYGDMDIEKKNPYISIKLSANLSTVTRFREEVGFTQPIIDTRQYNTSVSLEEGELILVGGLFRDSKVKKERGIPILRDVPIMGRLFRSSSNSQIVSQLFVMVRPVLVDIWSKEGREKQFLDHRRIDKAREMLNQETGEIDSGHSPFEQFRELFIERQAPK
jgi:general secretion pathway protein D